MGHAGVVRFQEARALSASFMTSVTVTGSGILLAILVTAAVEICADWGSGGGKEGKVSG